jgi:catechol 2,3-dioxygenase-like lactoylglutathione lyase family enzyme
MPASAEMQFHINCIASKGQFFSNFGGAALRSACSVTVCICALTTPSCSLTRRPPAGLKTLSRIDHFALNVTSLEKSAAFYSNVFGFSIVNKWKTVWMVGNEHMRIGLFERPKATAVTDPDTRLIISHVAFLTDEKGFDASVSQLDQLGLPHEPVEDTGIAKSVFIHDPDGHELEITYYYQKKPAP